MTICVLAAQMLLSGAGVDPAGRLAVVAVVGLATYLPTLALLAPDTIAEFRRLRPSTKD